MRILYITLDLGENGIDSWVKNYSQVLLNNSNQVDFVIFYNNTKIPQSNYPKSNIYKIPSYSSGIPVLSTLKSIMSILKSRSYDIVHVHHDNMSSIPLLALKLCGYKNRIVHSHTTNYPNSNRKYLYNFFKKFINFLATDRFAVSWEAADFLYNSTSDIYIVNSAVNTQRFKYSYLNRNKIRSRLRIKETDVTVGIIGRLSHVKNHSFFLEIAQRMPSYKFFIIGDGELKNEIVKKTKKAKLDNVFLLGNKKDIEEYFSMLDILLMPSLFEGIPFTLIEAQANGLKILASKHIKKEADITGTISFLDLIVDEWVEEIKYFERYNRESRSIMNQKRIIKNGYDLSTEGKKLEEIYMDILARK